MKGKNEGKEMEMRKEKEVGETGRRRAVKKKSIIEDGIDQEEHKLWDE